MEEQYLSVRSKNIEHSSIEHSIDTTVDDYLIRKRYREFFLRFMIEYWMDNILLVKTDHYKIGMFKKLINNESINNLNQGFISFVLV